MWIRDPMHLSISSNTEKTIASEVQSRVRHSTSQFTTKISQYLKLTITIRNFRYKNTKRHGHNKYNTINNHTHQEVKVVESRSPF